MQSDNQNGSFVQVANDWLEQNVTTRHGNIHAAALLKLAAELDALGDHNPDDKKMNKKQHADAVRQYIEAIEKKQTKILEETDTTAVAGIRRWAATSTVWLGMIPLDMLSEQLYRQVKTYLHNIHGIELSALESETDDA